MSQGVLFREVVFVGDGSEALQAELGEGGEACRPALLLLHPGLLAGADLLRAMVPFEPETPPDLSETPVV